MNKTKDAAGVFSLMKQLFQKSNSTMCRVSVRS